MILAATGVYVNILAEPTVLAAGDVTMVAVALIVLIGCVLTA